MFISFNPRVNILSLTAERNVFFCILFILTWVIHIEKNYVWRLRPAEIYLIILIIVQGRAKKPYDLGDYIKV